MKKMEIFKNKKILVTGGTGSFGETITRHLLNSKASEIRILSRDEKKQEDLRRKLLDKRLSFIVGDVRDRDSVNMSVSGIDFIFQAAALKQVPSCEFYPMEAVKTNVIGTSNILTAAVKNAVQKVVVLSTDKAVYPINAMGISKAMMEKIAISKARESLLHGHRTKIMVTRYGNVMCSRGSLIPFIINKIKNKENLTVTDPNMTRFMMSLDESVNLVLKAFQDGKTGDIFVQKAPAATVLDVVTALKKIFNSKSKIVTIGARHGEKIHETLCSSEEMSSAINLGKYFRVPANLRNINYDIHVKKNNVQIKSQQYDSSNTKQLSLKSVIALLQKQPYVKEQLLSS